MGCLGHALIAEQELSVNYALLEGVHSTSPEMIDGNLNTVGVTTRSRGPGKLYGSSNATEVIITLPEKKSIHQIIIHSDNIKKFVIYANKGGTIHSDTDWQLLKDIKMVNSNPFVIPISYPSPTDRLRLVVLDTSDAAALNRKAKAEFLTKQDEEDRNPNANSNRSNRSKKKFEKRQYPARINEIEIYGYKSAKETEAAKSDPQREEELNSILQ